MITTTSIGSAGVSVADDETNTCIDIKNKIGVVGGWFRAMDTRETDGSVSTSDKEFRAKKAAYIM